MANLLLLKKRIQTSQNVSKTTRALQMIATSKLKKAQDAALLSRPYVDKLSEVSQGLASKVDKQNLHGYMQKNENINKQLVICITPDKGLCGGMLTNLAREIISFEDKHKPYYITVGRKAEIMVSKISKDIVASFPFGTSLPPFDMVYSITKIMEEYFLAKKVSHVKILTTKFVNLFTQTPTIKTILPVDVETELDKGKTPFSLFEPNITDILPALLKQYIEMVVYQNLLESYASEQGARTIAMKNATDNAISVMDELKLEYNKTRQEKITNEILDISGSSFAIQYA
jgi:F-type H+-transporting ATPase subunit gamma